MSGAYTQRTNRAFTVAGMAACRGYIGDEHLLKLGPKKFINNIL